jgi:hypothetical protein
MKPEGRLMRTETMRLPTILAHKTLKGRIN